MGSTPTSPAGLRSALPGLPAAVRDLPDATLTAALAEASHYWRYSAMGCYLVAAHLLLLASQAATVDGGSGEVTQETVGPQIRIYRAQADAGWEVFWVTTPYGRRFLSLSRRSPRRQLGSVLVR